MTWVVFPTANTKAADETLNKWHAQGYTSCVLIDGGQDKPGAHHVIELEGEYGGFSVSVNRLCVYAMSMGARIAVVAGDDIDPDPNRTAEQISGDFFGRFPTTFGVMQPMGDAYGALDKHAPIRAAVSPWIGRQFAMSVNGGRGPYWTEYKDLWGDTELWHVAEQLGVLWPNPDVTQFHRHWTRGFEDRLPKAKRQRIEKRAGADMKLFMHRRGMGFPGYQVEE